MSVVPRCLVCQAPLKKNNSRQIVKYCSRGKKPRPGSGGETSCRRLRTILTREARNRVP